MAKDAVLVDAVDLARDAAVEAAGDADLVGEHLSATADEDRLVTHLFACVMPGYRGWVWSVTLARAPRQKFATVCEAHLVPADDALLAPPWVPWADRIRPGDLEPSMVMPFIPDDARVVPGYEATGDEDADALAIWELGLGRPRVLGPEGRADIADRWYRGSHGPTAASAIASNAQCSTCAFFIPLTGSMRQSFGACANEWSPSDGRVVSVDHGCGAHSETDVERGATQWPDVDPVFQNQTAIAVELDDEPEDRAEQDEPGEVEAAGDTEAVGDAEATGDAEAVPDRIEVDGDTVETEVAPTEPVDTPAPVEDAPASDGAHAPEGEDSPDAEDASVGEDAEERQAD